MDLKYHEILQQCWDKNIKVIQKPCGVGNYKKPPRVKLIISIDFNYIQGKELYHQNSTDLEKALEKVYRHLHKHHVIN